jgi:hypothetical protein
VSIPTTGFSAEKAKVDANIRYGPWSFVSSVSVCLSVCVARGPCSYLHVCLLSKFRVW